VGDAVTPQRLAVQLVQQLRVAQLHPIAEVAWQLPQEGVELLGPAPHLRQVAAVHRLKLEYEAPRVVAERARVRQQHGILE